MYDTDATTITLAYIFLYILAFFAAVFITRAIFAIPKFLRYQKAQLKLAALQALQSGADKEAIKGILKEANDEFGVYEDYFEAQKSWEEIVKEKNAKAATTA